MIVLTAHDVKIQIIIINWVDGWYHRNSRMYGYKSYDRFSVLAQGCRWAIMTDTLSVMAVSFF